jgi:hypothetical protein
VPIGIACVGVRFCICITQTKVHHGSAENRFKLQVFFAVIGSGELFLSMIRICRKARGGDCVVTCQAKRESHLRKPVGGTALHARRLIRFTLQSSKHKPD